MNAPAGGCARSKGPVRTGRDPKCSPAAADRARPPTRESLRRRQHNGISSHSAESRAEIAQERRHAPNSWNTQHSNPRHCRNLAGDSHRCSRPSSSGAENSVLTISASAGSTTAAAEETAAEDPTLPPASGEVTAADAAPAEGPVKAGKRTGAADAAAESRAATAGSLESSASNSANSSRGAGGSRDSNRIHWDSSYTSVSTRPTRYHSPCTDQLDTDSTEIGPTLIRSRSTSRGSLLRSRRDLPMPGSRWGTSNVSSLKQYSARVKPVSRKPGDAQREVTKRAVDVHEEADVHRSRLLLTVRVVLEPASAQRSLGL